MRLVLKTNVFGRGIILVYERLFEWVQGSLLNEPQVCFEKWFSYLGIFEYFEYF